MRDIDSQDRAAIMRQIIKRRRSTRRFSEQPIPQDLLEQLVEAGIDAPSGSNWQNQRFLIVQDKTEIQRIGKTRFVWPYRTNAAETNPSGILGHATALILVFAEAACSDMRAAGEYHIWEPLEIQNCAASIQNICLMATASGIANCWVSASPSMNNTRLLSNQTWHRLLSEYAIPATCKIQGVIILGYPRATDKEGYPKGEKKHGATIWASVERGPIEQYLIQKAEIAEASKLSSYNRARLRGLSFLAKRLRRWLCSTDKRIEIIERKAIGLDYSRDQKTQRLRA